MKKFLALMCILAVMVCISVMAPTPAEATEYTYQVGYARVDINPYVVDGDLSSGIMQLPLRGSGDVWNRLSTDGLVDDNGDGVIDENDGLKATCVAVSDQNGKTVLMINVDLIGGGLLSKVNTAIMERVEAEIAAGTLSNVDLAKEAIYYGGTHTHSAPDTTVYVAAGKTGTNNDGVDLAPINENLGIWINRTIEDVADAAIIALKDRAAATISKDQLSASDATDPVVAGKKMVTTRHLINGEDGSIAGDNFNDRGSNPTQITEADDTMYLLRFDFTDSSKLPIIFTGWRGHPSLNNSDTYDNSGKNCISSDYVNAYRHALEFGVDVTINTDYGVGHVESWELGDTQKYRVIFFNGTGGNTNPRNTEVQYDENGNALTYGSGSTVRGYSWIDVSASKAAIKGRACSYGVVLATMAQECLDDGKNETAVAYGEIKTTQSKMSYDRKQVGVTQLGYNAAVSYWEADALYDAAYAAYTTANTKFSAYKTAYEKWASASSFLQWLYKSDMDNALSAYNTANATLNTKLTAYEEYMAANTNNTASQASTTTVNGNAGPTKPLQSHPYLYKEGDQVYPIGSRFHANAVKGDWDNNLGMAKTAGGSVTLNAFMIGEELAFVVIPGEPFDYYYTEYGVYTPENNLWNILNDSTYGKAMVLGYTNGASGYFPNYEAYYYNEGSTTKVMGSYESHTTDFAPGTGEKMVYTLDSMLAALSAEEKTAYCEHCKKDVVWQPYCMSSTIYAGHYYMTADYTGGQVRIADNEQVCFDLNGHSFTGEVARAFYLETNCTTVLSIMDSSAEQTGVVKGLGGDIGAPAGYGGKTIFVGKKGTLNLYGGTLTGWDKGTHSVYAGGVLFVRGTVNVYGGRIQGSTVYAFTGQYLKSGVPTDMEKTAAGGAIVSSGTLNLYGGEILSGTAQLITGTVIGTAELGYGYTQTTEPIEIIDPCISILSGGAVNIGGDCSIDNLYFADGLSGKLTLKGLYTGSAELGYPDGTSVGLGTAVGVALADDDGNGADVTRSRITVKGCDGLYAAVKNAQLVLSESQYKQAYCEDCQRDVYWKPVGNAELNVYNTISSSATQLPAGHYVLYEDVLTAQKQLNGKGDQPGTFCFDLAGHTFTGMTRAFYVYDSATLNIFDSAGDGTIVGNPTSATGGGVLYVQGANGRINLYDGTLIHDTTKAPVIKTAGIVRINKGSFYMYGGEIRGTSVEEYGGAIYMSAGTCYIGGGRVISGTASKLGNGIYAASGSNMILAGDAYVEDLYMAGNSGNDLTVDTTNAAFTGFVQLTFATTPEAGEVLGTCTGTNGIAAGSVSLTGSTLPVRVVSGKLTTKLELKSFHLIDGDGVYATFDTFAEALAAYTYDADRGNYIQLTKDVSNATVDKTVVVDLNGFYLSHPTICDGVVLYAMDAQTDDFTIEDDMAYGMVYYPTIDGEGTVVACDGYLRITEGKSYSFHRVIMQIKSMSLRASAAGVYYTCEFKGDEIVCENVKSCGIALSAWMEPTAANLNEMCLFTANAGFVSGESQGVLLSGIMKDTNTAEKNCANGETAVFGRAYIETADGYTFGACVTRTLRQQLEDIDLIWTSLTDVQKASVLSMYEQFSDAMTDWNIPNIKAA